MMANPGLPEATRPLLVAVDDDPLVLAALRRLFRREPYEVVTTVDPEEALERIRTRDVRLVIADQRMPEMLGTELLKVVRKISPRTVCVILTGHADLSDVAGAMNDGAVHRLIKKPWDDQEFRDVIKRLLGAADDHDSEFGVEPAQAAPRNGGAATPSPARSVIRVDCRRRSAAEVLQELWRSLEGPDRSAPSAIVFESLRELPDSLSSFLAEVVRRIVRTRLRTSIVDESGIVSAFVALVGRFLPVVTYASESELPAPRRVLVVEDQLESLEFLQTVIESAGHVCDAVTSVSEAIRKLDASRFDAVLLDLVLPDAEGLEVARHILERGLRVPIIAVSANMERLESGPAGSTGIRRQVRKPYRARDILQAICES